MGNHRVVITSCAKASDEGMLTAPARLFISRHKRAKCEFWFVETTKPHHIFISSLYIRTLQRVYRTISDAKLAVLVLPSFHRHSTDPQRPGEFRDSSVYCSYTSEQEPPENHRQEVVRRGLRGSLCYLHLTFRSQDCRARLPETTMYKHWISAICMHLGAVQSPESRLWLVGAKDVANH